MQQYAAAAATAAAAIEMQTHEKNNEGKSYNWLKQKMCV